MHFARVAGENLVSPDEKATGHRHVRVRRLPRSVRLRRAGRRLGQADRRADRLHRGPWRRGAAPTCDVREVVTDGNGRAHRRRARQTAASSWRRMASSAQSTRTYLGRWSRRVSPTVAKNALRTQISPAACITVHAALERAAQVQGRRPLGGDERADARTEYEDMRRSFDELRYGEMSHYPAGRPRLAHPARPIRAPAGKAIIHAWDYVPYERPDGRSWDDTKREYAEADDRADGQLHRQRARERARRITATARSTWSAPRRASSAAICTASPPPPISRAPPPDARARPVPVPGVERLYLVGPFQHPGGGVFGAGRAAAMRAFEDLKIDFNEKVGRGMISSTPPTTRS